MTTIDEKKLEEFEKIQCPFDDIVGFDPETIDGRGEIEIEPTEE